MGIGLHPPIVGLKAVQRQRSAVGHTQGREEAAELRREGTRKREKMSRFLSNGTQRHATSPTCPAAAARDELVAAAAPKGGAVQADARVGKAVVHLCPWRGAVVHQGVPDVDAIQRQRAVLWQGLACSKGRRAGERG